MSNRIVITTDYLHPGDTVDTMPRERGLEPAYSPATGTNRTAEQGKGQSLLWTVIDALGSDLPDSSQIRV